MMVLGVIEMVGASGFGAATTDRRSRTEFADLVLAESAWLDTEFAAIVAANFGAPAVDPDLPTPSPPHRDRPAASRPGRRTPVPIGHAPPTEHSRMARRVGACERSPPLRPIASNQDWRGGGADGVRLRLESAVDSSGTGRPSSSARRLVTRAR
jgi:hypothetical protein